MFVPLAGGALWPKLLATKLDAILTSDLTTGRDAARAKRKELIGTTEALIDRVEGLVKRVDAAKAAASPAKVPDAAEAPATAAE